MKRILAILLAALLITGAMVGCGSSDDEENEFDNASTVATQDTADTVKEVKTSDDTASEEETDTTSEEDTSSDDGTDTDSDSDSDSDSESSSSSSSASNSSSSSSSSSSTSSANTTTSSAAAASNTSSANNNTATSSAAASSAAVSSAVSSAEETSSASFEMGGAMTEDDLVFTYNDSEISLGDSIDSVYDKLGDPLDSGEAGNCVTGGSLMYLAYGDFTVYTYPDGDEQYVYNIVISETSIETLRGISVGSSLDDLLAAYGSDYDMQGSSTYRYYFNDTMYISFYVANDAVAEISYIYDYAA